MIVAELATYHIPANPASPTSVAVYVVVCSMFYKRGFGAPTHRFLHFLLQFYGLELHHLTPLGILQIVAFISLCIAYMGIDPHFNMWIYFFHIWLRPDLDVAVAVWGCVEIYVRTESRIDHTSTSRSPTHRLDGGKSGSS
jgi:hypothetical protein